MKRSHIIGHRTYSFDSLKCLLAKASPERSGDQLAGVSASSREERIAAQMTLADLPLADFLNEEIIPYAEDEVTRLIIDSHDKTAFTEVSSFTVGDFRNWLLNEMTDGPDIKRVSPGLTPEMVAAVSKIMKNQDLILAASKVRNVTAFRTTVGLAGRLSTRLQPNDPTDDPRSIAAEIIDGLLMGSGDAVIGINPASDNYSAVTSLLIMLDRVREKYSIPTQSCVLTHITTTIKAIEQGVPVDLVFQSIGGTEKVNSSFGINIAALQEGYEAGSSLKRGSIGSNVMYFETGHGSALSANAHHGADQ